MKAMKARVTLMEEILGTLPGDPEVYKNWIASKAPTEEKTEEEVEMMTKASAEEEFAKGITVFPRDPEGHPSVYDYLIKGFFKNACNAMRDADSSVSAGLSAYKKKIDNLVFIAPRYINLQFEGSIGFCERPLRASTAQGERVAIACSESIPAGTVLEFEVSVLKDEMMNYVVEWLDYGKFNGLGQWHNSGKGRFTWEDVSEVPVAEPIRKQMEKAAEAAKKKKEAAAKKKAKKEEAAAAESEEE
jgi:hypothetical protein